MSLEPSTPIHSRVIVTRIEAPKFACTCGWTSYSPLYNLKYHRDHHKCDNAKWLLSRNKE